MANTWDCHGFGCGAARKNANEIWNTKCGDCELLNRSYSGTNIFSRKKQNFTENKNNFHQDCYDLKLKHRVYFVLFRYLRMLVCFQVIKVL